MKRYHFGDLGADERIIFKWFLKKSFGVALTKFNLA
jgi:hypothetical protein